MDNYGSLDLVATCLFGLESIVADEIRRLGYETVQVSDGRIRFRGDAAAIARCNLWLRCAERVLILAGEYDAPTFDALFEGAKAIAWERLLPRDAEFPVAGHTLNSALHSVPDCQAIIKKAAAVRMGGAYGLATLPETGARHAIHFLIMKDHASLMIDTSGAALHKRGYREQAGVAPLRETIAAAMLRLSRWRAGDELRDPFCGSGTIVIEAALMGENRAPGLRRKFAAMQFPGVPQAVWENAAAEALDLIAPGDFVVHGTDIDPDCVALAAKNAGLAGVAKRTCFSVMDARGFDDAGGRFAKIISNPPYGDRMMEIREAQALTRDMGALLSGRDFDMFLLSADDQFEQLFGRRATKRRKLYNGMKTCQLYQYIREKRV